MPRWVVTLFRMLPAVGGASVVAIVGLWLARLVIPIEALRDTNDEVGNYLQALVTIYAVVAAFVVFVVWSQFNESRTQVEREASELEDLYRLADGLPDGDQREMQALLARYVDAVLDQEWEALSRNDEAVIQRTGRILDEIWEILHCCELQSECHKSLHAEALTRFADLTDIRTARLTSARLRIPLALRLLLYIGGAICVASIYLLAVDRFWVHAVMTGALAAAVSHVLYIVHDLDDAWAGDWQVPRDAFTRVRRYMAQRAAATTAPDPDAAAA